MIEISNLKKSFYGSNEVKALDGVSLRVEKGEIFGIMGRSGAGKTTLLRILSLLERADEGEISICGEKCADCSPKQAEKIRKSIGVAGQSCQLFMQKTIEKNVAFPLEIAKIPKNRRAEITENLLKSVGLWEKRKDYPASLSGGQRQRVALARALALSPEVLLLDEPTSALDRDTAFEMVELLKSINREKNVTMVVISHDENVVRNLCVRVVFMEKGKIRERRAV